MGIPLAIPHTAIVGLEGGSHFADMLLMRVTLLGLLLLGRIAGPPFAAIGLAIEADLDAMGLDDPRIKVPLAVVSV